MLPPNVVISNPLDGFRWWSMDEIYVGAPPIQGVSLFIPKVMDCIIDNNDVMWRVIAVDSVTYLSTLRIFDPSVAAQLLQGVSSLSRIAPYQQMMRAFLNTEVQPYTLNLDRLFIIPGSENAFIKVFQGVNVSPTGRVISQTYDGNGRFISENVPLVLLDPVNPNYKQPLGFNCNTNFNDGEVLTVVVYTVSGAVTGQYGFLIKNTNLIRGLGQNQKEVVSVSLLSNLLDTVNGSMINAPANISIFGANFQAQVTYSDGSTQRIPVGTNKCKLYGLEGFNPSIVGVISDLELVYYLDQNEAAINVSNPNVRSVPATYQIRAVDAPGVFSFKVFVVPNFNISINRYSNDYYLCSLDRTVFVKLTSNQYKIVVNNGSILDNGAFTNTQTFVIVVDIASVLPIGYNGYIFPQETTLKYGISNEVGWILDYRNDSVLTYGEGVKATYSATGNQVFDISCGQTSLTDWLQLLYEPIHVIRDITLMLAPPPPTHMRFLYNGVYSPWLAVDAYWNIPQANFFSNAFTTDSTICIVWGLLMPDGITYGTLGVSPLPLFNTF